MHRAQSVACEPVIARAARSRAPIGQDREIERTALLRVRTRRTRLLAAAKTDAR